MKHEQLKVTLTQVGIREKTGHNDGEPEKYIRALGLPLQSPYCVAGVYWSFLEAAHTLGLSESNVPMPRTGLASAVLAWVLKVGEAAASKLPEVSDLMVWRYDVKVTGHMAQVMKVGRGGWVVTMNYNTSIAGEGTARDGGGNALKWHNYMHPLGRMKFRGFIGFKEEPC